MAVVFDFSKLDAMDMLDLACYIEREAAETYEYLVGWSEANSPEAASFFARMARLEGAHDSRLEERRRALFGDAPPRYRDTAPWEVEVPDIDTLGGSLTLKQALELALGAEERAESYFRQAREYISDSQTATVLQELADEEVEHQLMLKRELARL